jgi:methylmalonyl-CoA carboxyltransferase large subunit
MTDLDILKLLDEIKATLGDLTTRVARLEQVGRSVPSVPLPTTTSATPQPPAQPAEPIITDEIVMVISAAVAAFLGERAHIRQIQLISSSAWAQQGRVSLQASHRLAR